MKFYKQEKDYTCGVACVRTLLSLFGCDVPTEEELCKALKSTNSKGTSPESIMEYFKQLGFQASAHIKSTLFALKNELALGHKPIFSWLMYGGHWSIAWDWFDDPTYNEGAFLIVDPAAHYNGRATMQLISGSTLEEMWMIWLRSKKRGLKGEMLVITR